MHRTIRRDRDPAWPHIDRVALELHAAVLRRVYVREALASFASAVAGFAKTLR